eukprot:TRINITY_DN22742_c0_g2_i1.p1 TRINITY_DN22742_c0_g2~~TRINITY_DN22742_c0_g2_i1.p1  ORF type:complete len:1178 (-),score=306.22 TRINITY_DN22742_c0_g2_i1:161-3370(-)
MYEAIFDSAPTLQSLFKTPKAIQAQRFLAEVQSFVDNLTQPRELKLIVETLAFRHLNLEVTVPRVMIFRDAIVDLLSNDLDEQHFTSEARRAFSKLLGWVGGANIFVKANYAQRLRVLGESWRKVNNNATKRDQEEAEARRRRAEEEAEAEKEEKAGEEDAYGEGDEMDLTDVVDARIVPASEAEAKGRCCGCLKGKKKAVKSEGQSAGQSKGSDKEQGNMATEAEATSSLLTYVPRTFAEMFEFNAQVMGFGVGGWMTEILNAFDSIVTHVTDAVRLQEECDRLAICIDKVSRGQAVNLSQFKSCMLGSLRSLLPKDWNGDYEVAWNWLWDNVERLIVKNLGNPAKWEAALQRFFGSLSEDQRYKARADIYERFFVSTPQGQEFFKQSDTRLHFIADKVFQMTTDLFADPWQMIEDLSELGLRHVGFGVPTTFFGAFVTACVEVVQIAAAEDNIVIEAFRWSLALIAKQLVRTITEGSTIVMKAVNINSKMQLQKAISLAPRGERAQWLLKIQVGSHSISPLMWAIESGSVSAAEGIIEDLLVIRADRERYYYGNDALFLRHQDIAGRLCREAPMLLRPLLDGLIWRSTRTENGQRRVNYYIKHLVVSEEGEPAEFLRQICMIKDPKLMVHDVVVSLSDTLWNGAISNRFFLSRIWFIVSLLLFMTSQAILPKIPELERIHAVRVAIFVMRCLMYLMTMCRLIVTMGRKCFKDFRKGKWKRVCCVPFPKCLQSPMNKGYFFLMIMLILMCAQEPMFYCLADEPQDWPTDDCEGREELRRRYSVFVMLAMGTHWFLMVDLSVFSTGLSAFVLVCAQVAGEIGQFLVALVFLLLTFASAVSVLQHDYFEMRDIPNSIVALFSITVLLFEDDYRNLQFEPALLITVFCFVLGSSIMLMNLLIAQLNNSYNFINQDMVGFARLNRAQNIVEGMNNFPKERWKKFVESLGLDEPLEFNQGDVGVPGGIQMLEPASAHVVLQDTVLRFGGSCAEEMQWPDENLHSAESSSMVRMENLSKKMLRRVTKELKEAKKKKHRAGETSGLASGLASSDGQGASGVESSSIQEGSYKEAL